MIDTIFKVYIENGTSNNLVYHWDRYRNKLVCEVLNVESSQKVVYLSCYNSINETAASEVLYSLNKIIVDPHNEFGQSIRQVLYDLSKYYDIRIFEERGRITIQVPNLKEFFIHYPLDHPYNKYYVTDDHIYFDITFNPDPAQPSDLNFRELTDQITNIYNYLKVYTEPRIDQSVVCCNCFSPESKSTKIKNHPLFTHMVINVADGKNLNEKCPGCGLPYSKTGIIYIDTPMVDLVKYLNNNGIETIACCAGHSWVDCDIYIGFKKNGIIETKLEKFMNEDDDAMLSLEIKDYYENDMIVLRANVTRQDLSYFSSFEEAQAAFIDAMYKLFNRYIEGING